MFLGLFGISWVMPHSVLGFMDYWQGHFGRHQNIRIWMVVPHYLMWCLWREQNGCSFEDSKGTIVELKLLFFRTLFDWVTAKGFVSCLYLQFMDFCL